MGKISRGAGPSHVVPPQTAAKIRQMYADGATIEQLRSQLNAWAVPYPDHNGVPRPGMWTRAGVQRILDGEIVSRGTQNNGVAS